MACVHIVPFASPPERILEYTLTAPRLFSFAQRKFAKLVDFIEQIPTLRDFGLFGISVGNVVQPLKLDGLSEARVMVEYPMLFALLTCLARTSLTTLVLATEAASGTRYKWKRSTREEPFQLEERVLSSP